MTAFRYLFQGQLSFTMVSPQSQVLLMNYHALVSQTPFHLRSALDCKVLALQFNCVLALFPSCFEISY